MARCFPYQPPAIPYSAAPPNLGHLVAPIKPTGGETDKIGARKDTKKRNLERKEEMLTTDNHSGLTEERGTPSPNSSDSVNRTENPPSGKKRIRLEESDVVSAKLGHRGGPIKPTGGDTDKIGARKDTEKRNLKRREEMIAESHGGLSEEHGVPVKRIRLDSAGADVRRPQHGLKSKPVRPYDALTNGWEFAAIQSEAEEDLGWLFNSRKHERRSGADREVDDSSFDSSCCSMWVKAQWLPGAGVYALPYTVPF